jgi:SNF2 family DNA or RNA helicase
MFQVLLILLQVAVKIVGYKNVEELVRKIAPVSFVIPKDVLGLPEKRYEVVPVPLAEEQARVYQMLEQQLIEDLHARRITNPANAAVRLMRLQQVLSGRVYTQSDDEDEPPVVRTVQSNRISTLIEVLTQYDGQAVIWARFAQDIKDIREALGDNAVTYDGSTSQADRETALTRFKSGDAAYFVGNPAAAGTGIDGLQCASMAVYYSNSFNSEQRWQSEDRIHRIGQRESTLYVDLGAPDTVDALIRKNLRAKGDLARSITENPNMLMQRED